MSKIEDFLFNQRNCELRVQIFTCSLITIICLFLLFGPFSLKNVEIIEALYPKDNSPFYLKLINENIYFYLRYSTIFLLLLSVKNRLRRYALPIATIQYILFEFYNYFLSPNQWLYNTHLIFFLVSTSILIQFKQSKFKDKTQSLILSFPIFYIGFLYFQAAFSKLWVSGLSWVIEAKTITFLPVILNNTKTFDILNIPMMPQLLSLSGIMIQFSIIFIIFNPKHYKKLIVLLFIFHLTAVFFVKVLFWYLIFLYPSLFLFQLRQTDEESP